MAPPEAADPPSHGGGSADEALRRLEQRLGRASEAAERLIAEATRAAGSARATAGTAGEAAARASEEPPPDTGAATGHPPPSGWQAPASEAERSDAELLLQVLQSVRELIPPELQRRLAEALRELLLALRALIDWYLERSERRRATAGEVQDIPIL